MKNLKIIILFIIVLSGCSNKYLESSEEGPISREWSVLDTEILKQNNVGLVLNLNVREFVEVRDSVKLARLYESKRRKVGSSKVLGGCVIAGCAALASASTVYSGLVNDPSNDMYTALALCYGIVGGVGALSFIVSGFSDVSKSDRTGPHYIKKNIICKNSKRLRNDKVRIKLENTNSEKTYYTDGYGITQLKFEEIIPEPTEADSILSLIIHYYELADTVKVRRLSKI